MATYADQKTEAEVGDIVKCVCNHGTMFKKLNDNCSYKVVRLCGDSVLLESESGHSFLANRFELIKRTGAAPSPEPEQPKVNGVYASGEVPEVGDEFEAIESYGSFYKIGDRFRIREFSHFGYIHADGLGGGFAAKRFKLISRKGQPAVNPMPAQEPLVKWPEPEKQPCSGHLPIGDFFTIECDDQKVWRVVDGGYIAWFGEFSSSAYVVWPHNNTPVRRLKMLVRPKFEVI